MTWEEKIQKGMALIIEGCKENSSWCDCHDKCPFDEMCTSIWEDKDTCYTTPDSWEDDANKANL